MPRGDGTGPMGRGSMTGRGMGYCAGYCAPGYANAGMYGGRFRARRFAFGRGIGFGWGASSPLPEREADLAYEGRLDALETKLDELACILKEMKADK